MQGWGPQTREWLGIKIEDSEIHGEERGRWGLGNRSELELVSEGG